MAPQVLRWLLILWGSVVFVAAYSAVGRASEIPDRPWLYSAFGTGALLMALGAVFHWPLGWYTAVGVSLYSVLDGVRVIVRALNKRREVGEPNWISVWVTVVEVIASATLIVVLQGAIAQRVYGMY